MSPEQDRRNAAPSQVGGPEIAWDALPLEAKERIECVCLAFEDAWKSGSQPSLESHLEQAPDSIRPVLVRELLLLELWYRDTRGEKVTSHEYVARLPQYRCAIQQAFQAAAGDTPAQTTAATAWPQAKSPLSPAQPNRAPKKEEIVPLEQFVQTLTESGLMTADEVRHLMVLMPAERQPRDGRDLAKELYRQGKLTSFQAQAIYQGKTRGLVMGNYVVLDRLGKGGMGQVYQARHRLMGRVVALKMLPSLATHSDEAVKRFHREVQAAARLSHPNIVTAFDADEAKGSHFLAMEYVEGRDLNALVKQQGPLSVPLAVNCVLQAARGLEYAHQQGIVHRDIKPANLLLDTHGRVRILDMGLAHIDAPEAEDLAPDEPLTHSGQILGTFDYMPPEQALDAKTVDARADIYSLGCTLYYLLAGRPPYAGGTVGQKIVAHREQPIPSLRAVRDDVTESLDRVFQRMLAKAAEGRQQSMSEVIVELKEGSDSLKHGAAPVAEAKRHLEASLQQSEAEPPSFLGPLSTYQPMELSRRLVSPRREGVRRVLKKHAVTILATASAALLVLLFAVILRVQTPQGTLVVEIDEPDVTVQVLNEKGEIVIQRAAGKGTLTIRVDPGRQRLKVQKEGMQLFTREFSIASGGRETIKAALVPVPKTEVPGAGRHAPGPAETAGKSGPEPPRAIAPFDAAKAKEHQQAWATHLGVPMEITNSIGMKLVLIPPGEFLMGTTEDDKDSAEPAHPAHRPVQIESPRSDRPRHLVRISKPYYLAATEVTQTQFHRVMGARQEYASPADLAAWNTSWNDAQEFCSRLSEAREEAGSGRTYRLPTEAEWEYACRAGTTTRHCFGDDPSRLGEYAWTRANSSGAAQRTAQKKPNAWGLYDMHGNLWEWCEDRYDPGYYTVAPLDDPKGPAAGDLRILRGGAWSNPEAEWFCSSARVGKVTGERYGDWGFRVACDGPRAGGEKPRPAPAVPQPAPPAPAAEPKPKPPPQPAQAKPPTPGPLVVEKATIRGHRSDVRTLAFSPDGETLASGSFDLTASLWSTKAGTERAMLRGHGLVMAVRGEGNPDPGVNCVVFAPNGQFLATGGLDSTARLWDAATGRQLRLVQHVRRVLSVAVSPKSDLVASADNDGMVKIWRADTGEAVRTLRHDTGVECVAFSLVGEMIASASWDGAVIVRDTRTWKERMRLTAPGDVRALAFAPNGKMLATSTGTAPVLQLWDVEKRSSRQLESAHRGYVYGLAFSPDGSVLASAGFDGAIRLWDPASGELLVTLRGHTGKVWCVAFSPDGTALASGGGDAKIILWDISKLAVRKADVTVLGSSRAQNPGARAAIGKEDRFSDWMSQQELQTHVKASPRNLWMTALEGRWHEGAVQGRVRWEPRTSEGGFRWFWCFDHDEASFREKSGQYAKEGFRLIHQQTFTRPDGALRYQGVWHRLAQP